jgi:hypothetical protein
MCICKHWTKFWGASKGFWHSERFIIGIVTMNRHDCWTFIIAYQIIFCSNLFYTLDIILFWRYELLPQNSSLMYIGVFGTLCGVQGNCILQWTSLNTCWYHTVLYLYQPNKIFKIITNEFFFLLLILIANLHKFIRCIHRKKSGRFHFSWRYRVCYFKLQKVKSSRYSYLRPHSHW